MIVVSDMMGTLTTGSPILGLLDWVRHNQSRSRADWITAAMLPGYFLTKTGLLDSQRWKHSAMIQSLDWVENVTPAKFADVAEWTVEKNLWKPRRVEVIARLSAHASAGGQVYLASSVFEPIASAFASRFGAKAIGSPLEFSDGRVRPAAGLVASERKIQEVLARLNVQRVDYAYGDTYMDIPLLENAQHPVAVYPDRQLYAAAKQRGWEIIGSQQ